MSVPGARRGALTRRPPMKRDAETLSSRFLTLGVLLLAVLTSPVAVSAPAPPAAASPSQVQFGGQCAEALAEGQHVQTNCAVTWTDKDGKSYCFATEAAKKTFLENPTANLQKARDFIAAGSAESTEKAMQSFASS